MSTGPVHISYWRRLMVPAVILCVLNFFVLQFINHEVYFSFIFSAAQLTGYLLGYFIDPDLDEVGLTSAEGRMMDKFKIIGAFMVAYWLPYAYINRFIGIGKKGHRNFFSHFPFVGTVIRLFYLLIPFWIWFVLDKQDLWDWQIICFIGLWAGLGMADSLHYYLDLFPKTE